MDFSYSDDQQAVIDLASQIFDEHATHERQREVEAQEGPRFDTELWKLLAEAGLIGAAIPEESGGAGLGFLEVAGILEQAGRHTAPIPLLETMVLAGLPIAAHGSAAQQEAWLPKFAAGEAIGTAALIEAQADPREPGTTATPEGAGFRLRGRKICVPSAELAAVVLVPARTPDGVGLFLVDPKAEGVVLTALDTTSGRPESALALDVVVGADAVLADASAGEAALDALLERANAAQAAFGLGVCTRALELTAEYAKTRKQFDQPIATFQAVGHRAADAYIDVEAIRLTTLQAAWRLAEGLPAAAHVALAKYWVAEAGQRVVAAAQHLHGGVGVDREYPLHRCYLLAKEIELALGGTTPQLLRIGRILADQPAA
jgi:alkylation response protein AidB-like acyl-CoA dehydrogenase